MDISKSKLRAIGALALFTYIFLACEFRFDIRIGILAGADSVVVAQGLILGASVIGFIGAALVASHRPPRIGIITASALAMAGALAIELLADAVALRATGCIAFLVLGALGTAAHASFARAFDGDPRLATGAGASYALGILLQFATNLVIPAGSIEALTLILAIAGLTVCTCDAPASGRFRPTTAEGTGISSASASSSPDDADSQPLSRAIWTVALVIILACMFSTLDNVVTLSNAHGTIAVQTWPRLFLAASGLAAGLLFDLAERRYMGLIMFGVTVLSTISVLAVEAGASPNLGLIVFYLGSGFFVTFFTGTFCELAPRMRTPGLWAGMGRAANNLCAFTTAGVSSALVSSNNVPVIMICTVIMLVAASVAFVAAGLFRLPQTAQEREYIAQAEQALAAPSIDEQRRAFIQTHGLTPREVDVLVAVTASEVPLKQVAEDLGISLRMVQRHLTSIYKKTGTQTRAGLTKAFPS